MSENPSEVRRRWANNRLTYEFCRPKVITTVQLELVAVLSPEVEFSGYYLNSESDLNDNTPYGYRGSEDAGVGK